MSDYVWISPENGKNAVPIGGCILSRAGNRIYVRDDDLNEYWITQKNILRSMQPTSVHGVEDMTYLEDLQEYSILRNLQIRYREDLIYTYIGSILVAVNPYKMIPIYDKNIMAEYRKKKLGELPPHIFAIADYCYESMRKMSYRRCIVVSGESGAGKTESTKLFLQYFAGISSKRSGIEKQILDSNPILEAFGNAKTVCNDNSSRFGKYISIYFNTNGSILSAEIKHYLLEKSRIVSQNSDEENYHIFYALLNGLTEDEKKQLKLTNVAAYHYLNTDSNKSFQSSKRNPNHNLQSVKSAMIVLNFSQSEIWQIFEILAAILHLGNIEFKSILMASMETVRCEGNEIQSVCSLLKISEEDVKSCLTEKAISMQGEHVVKMLSKQEAINSRDAFVKKIFKNLFDYIVEKINENLSAGGKNTPYHIGILDIFGFEVFHRNSFEQLCINYANERLQQFFIGHAFKKEQETYASEGITWEFVDYPDNKEILDLIEREPKSILSAINDCTKMPRGTDQTLLNKLIEYHSENPFFIKPKIKNTLVFGIQHYAGKVLYDTKDIIEKNYDSCSADFKKVVQKSGNEFLKRIFSNDLESESSEYHKRRLETLVSKFKNSLDSLMNELNECQPFFVRCIKPNEMKKPQKFDRTLCCRQLKYSGMTEVTKVREVGYPVRYSLWQFVQQYRVFAPGTSLDAKEDWRGIAEKICETAFNTFPNPNYRLGRTKIFLKHPEELFLEAEKEKALFQHAVNIQKLVRSWLVRRRVLKLKMAVATAENCWLKKKQLARAREIRDGFYRLQAKLKSNLLSVKYQKQKILMTRLQALCRGHLLRKTMKKELEDIKRRTKPNDSSKFKDFAKRHFQGNISYKYSKKPIETSLTRLVHPDDVAAAKAIWLTILSYTKNISEPTKGSGKVSQRALLKEILNAIEERNKNSAWESDSITLSTEQMTKLYGNWLKQEKTELDKVHFIVSHGIRRPELRDEIYCQICKALTKNPSKKKSVRGWELLSSCIGCFAPSNVFLRHLKTFVREGPKRYTSFCLFRLHRVFQNGCRNQPPFETELLAIRNQKPVQVDVHLANGAVKSLKIDSGTTARELLDTVAKSIKLTDPLGFTFVLAGSEGKGEMSIGDGSCFVLDAVSLREQEMEGGSDGSRWKLYLKKEMFTPWDCLGSNEVANNLVYHQIKQGILAGCYGSQDAELANVIAQVCYVEVGRVKQPYLSDVVSSCFPPLGHSENLKKQVEQSYEKMFENGEAPQKAVRDAIIKHAIVKWVLHFSRYFNAVGSIRTLKREKTEADKPLIVAVNALCIFVFEPNNETHLTEITYPDIHEIKQIELANRSGYVLKITSYKQVEVSLTFDSLFDNDLYKLLRKIIQNSKKYSKFVMAVKDYEKKEKSFLTFEKGDLIKLSDKYKGEDLEGNGWCEGTNERTGERGHFILECVKIIPTMEAPSEPSVKAMRDVLLHGRRVLIPPLVEKYKYYTLESYAKKYFAQIKNDKKFGKKFRKLWKYSVEPIERPLLQGIVSNEKMAEEAVQIFAAILQYQENEGKQLEIDEQLIQKIFNPGMGNDELKNEIYCQIMKQLTSNTDDKSRNRAWELMLFVTGLFPCEETLANEVKKFLQSRRTIEIARECLTRFNVILGKEPRKCPPHAMEVEAVKNRPCHIFHRVYFPDDTNKFFKINSLTKFEDLKEIILKRLRLSDKNEFSFFIQILERLFLVPDHSYVFDSLQIFKTWIDGKKISDRQYKICFMKSKATKSLSYDITIDLKFVFPHEYIKYIQGFHKIPKEDIIQLAAMLYKLVPSEWNHEQLGETLKKVVPSRAMNMMKPQLWRDEITANYTKNYLTSSVNECKIKFLKHLFKFTSPCGPYFSVLPEKPDVKNYMLYAIKRIHAVDSTA